MKCEYFTRMDSKSHPHVTETVRIFLQYYVIPRAEYVTK
jgi:hypothetical protein